MLAVLHSDTNSSLSDAAYYLSDVYKEALVEAFKENGEFMSYIFDKKY